MLRNEKPTAGTVGNQSAGCFPASDINILTHKPSVVNYHLYALLGQAVWFEQRARRRGKFAQAELHQRVQATIIALLRGNHYDTA